VDFFGNTDKALALALQSNGRIIAGGFSTTAFGNDTNFTLMAFSANGSPDSSFGSNGQILSDLSGLSDIVNALAVLPDNRIVAAGQARSNRGDNNFALARYKATSFDICVQDETSKDVFQIDLATGDYQFTKCSTGLVLNGTGTLINKGGILSLRHNTGDRRVLARLDMNAKKGTASIQVLSLGGIITIMDRNTGNNTCGCS
jgi:uncharacterized delta-60 repeat protein